MHLEWFVCLQWAHKQDTAQVACSVPVQCAYAPVDSGDYMRFVSSRHHGLYERDDCRWAERIAMHRSVHTGGLQGYLKFLMVSIFSLFAVFAVAVLAS